MTYNEGIKKSAWCNKIVTLENRAKRYDLFNAGMQYATYSFKFK